MVIEQWIRLWGTYLFSNSGFFTGAELFQRSKHMLRILGSTSVIQLRRKYFSEGDQHLFFIVHKFKYVRK